MNVQFFKIKMNYRLINIAKPVLLILKLMLKKKTSNKYFSKILNIQRHSVWVSLIKLILRLYN